MNNFAPVLIVDDDQDDHALVKEIWTELELKNQLVFFENGQKLLSYLEKDSTVPFLIICDVNIPGMDGFELRKRLIEDSRFKYLSIPFVFWSNKASEQQIRKAYDVAAHGFFIKDVNFEGLKRTFIDILEYWFKSAQPVIKN